MKKVINIFGENQKFIAKVCLIIFVVFHVISFVLNNITTLSYMFSVIAIMTVRTIAALAGYIFTIIFFTGAISLFVKNEEPEEKLIDYDELTSSIVPVVLTDVQTKELKMYSDTISRYLSTHYVYHKWTYIGSNEAAYANLVKYGRTKIKLFARKANKEVTAIVLVNLRDALTILSVMVESGVAIPVSEPKDKSKTVLSEISAAPVDTKKVSKPVDTKKVSKPARKKTVNPAKQPKKVTPTPTPQPKKESQQSEAPHSNVLTNNNVIIVNGKPQIRPNYEMTAKDWISANMRYINEACESSLMSNDCEGEKVVALLKKEKLPKEKETWQFIGKLLKDDYNEIDRFSVSEEGITIEID